MCSVSQLFLVGVVVGAVSPFAAAMAVKTISEKTWSCSVLELWRSDTFGAVSFTHMRCNRPPPSPRVGPRGAVRPNGSSKDLLVLEL